MINKINLFRRGIAASWIGMIFLSLILIATHRHDPIEEHVSCTHEQQDHQQSHPQDAEHCVFCILLLQQQADLLPTWKWEAENLAFLISKQYLVSTTAEVFFLKIFYKGLRAPPMIEIPFARYS